MLTEQTILDDQISIDREGNISVREADVILRDGEPDPDFPPRYHRYVLHPGDDLSGCPSRIAAIATAAWAARSN